MNNVVHNEHIERNAMSNHFFDCDMANASRILLMTSAVGLLATGAVMLFKNSESTLVIVPIIGATILMGFGYFLFDAREIDDRRSTAGVLTAKDGHLTENQPTGEELPDLISSDYEIPIL
jgi:hypothetical protein